MAADDDTLLAEAATRRRLEPLQNALVTWEDIFRMTHRSVRQTIHRRHPSQHSDEVTTALYKWLFEAGFDYPYAQGAERDDLLRRTGLTRKQLTYWLTNARKRVWAPIRKRLGLPVHLARRGEAMASPIGGPEADPAGRGQASCGDVGAKDGAKDTAINNWRVEPGGTMP
ncbi:hypothetical protein FNF27_00666 [Cafeteria roenbergensis]|uniref:Homeobox domain-containing protein n=1 Tax=Cafeteria roenbergensis TaxID=33653 RepID=A0A5A8ELY0_CAFRO|nr:hypothetical protein FNF27_00666 [Cafeteria roenbergensis]